jgi:ubiquinone/menaquinone biosynthesis C-methylase UbiE
MKILDLGCGSGGWLELRDDRISKGSWLYEFGGSWAYGVDINPGYIKDAEKSIGNGTSFFVADARFLPFPDEFFTVIHASGALHHMTDYKLALKEISRVLSKDGILLLKESVDNDFIFACLRRLAGKWRGDDVESFYTTDILLDSMKESGLIVTDKEYYWRFYFSDWLVNMNIYEPKISMLFCRLISRIFKFLNLDRRCCSHIVVTAIRAL